MDSTIGRWKEHGGSSFNMGSIACVFCYLDAFPACLFRGRSFLHLAWRFGASTHLVCLGIFKMFRSSSVTPAPHLNKQYSGYMNSISVYVYVLKSSIDLVSCCRLYHPSSTP